MLVNISISMTLNHQAKADLSSHNIKKNKLIWSMDYHLVIKQLHFCLQCLPVVQNTSFNKWQKENVT